MGSSFVPLAINGFNVALGYTLKARDERHHVVAKTGEVVFKDEAVNLLMPAPGTNAPPRAKLSRSIPLRQTGKARNEEGAKDPASKV